MINVQFIMANTRRFYLIMNTLRQQKITILLNLRDFLSTEKPLNTQELNRSPKLIRRLQLILKKARMLNIDYRKVVPYLRHGKQPGRDLFYDPKRSLLACIDLPK